MSATDNGPRRAKRPALEDPEDEELFIRAKKRAKIREHSPELASQPAEECAYF